MSDLISRQAILDRTVNKNSIWNKITDSKGYNLEDILNSIPSVENKCFDGMTNGEVLQALFPNMKTEDTSFESLIGTDIDRGYVVFKRDWWNAPYQKGGE